MAAPERRNGTRPLGHEQRRRPQAATTALDQHGQRWPQATADDGGPRLLGHKRQRLLQAAWTSGGAAVAPRRQWQAASPCRADLVVRPSAGGDLVGLAHECLLVVVEREEERVRAGADGVGEVAVVWRAPATRLATKGG